MKKSTKISIIVSLVGLVFFVVGVAISIAEVISGRWGTFAEDVVDSVGIVNMGGSHMAFNTAYGSDIDRIIVNVDADKVKYKESKDNQVHIEYGKNVVVSQEESFITISNETNPSVYGINVYDEESDSYVSIGENGIYVGDSESDTDVSIDCNGVKVETEGDDVNIDIPFFGRSKNKYDVIVYLPKDFKGTVVD